MWPREGKDANEEREERQERVVVVTIDDRLDVIAVAGDAQVPPAIPRRQAAQERRSITAGQSGVPGDEVLGDDRGKGDDHP